MLLIKVTAKKRKGHCSLKQRKRRLSLRMPFLEEPGSDAEMGQVSKQRLGKEQQSPGWVGLELGRDTVLVKPACKGSSGVWKLPWLKELSFVFSCGGEGGGDSQEVCSEYGWGF